MDYQYLRSHLEKKGTFEFYRETRQYTGVRFESGLTKREFDDLEREFDFRFPPDLREFLSLGLPISRNDRHGWVNWRTKNKREILKRLNWPYEGICLDIEHSNFWLKSWGEKPSALSDRIEKVKGLINKAPRLIPIYSHRYIPDRPHETDNPIFSVVQTDIVHYGSNMENYLKNEFYYYFGLSVDERSIKEPFKVIEFWTEIVKHSMPPVPPFKKDGKTFYRHHADDRLYTYTTIPAYSKTRDFAVNEVLLRLPPDAYDRLLGMADAFAWDLLDSSCQARRLSSSKGHIDVISLGRDLERESLTSVIAAVAHQLAYVVLGHLEDRGLGMFEVFDAEHRQQEVLDLAERWGFDEVKSDDYRKLLTSR